jgi:hypothetical protein
VPLIPYHQNNVGPLGSIRLKWSSITLEIMFSKYLYFMTYFLKKIAYNSQMIFKKDVEKLKMQY